MRSQSIGFLAMIFGVVLSAGIAPPIHGTNLTLGLNECQRMAGAPGQNLVRGITGVSNNSPTATMQIVCNLPLATELSIGGGSPDDFFIDGDNAAGAQTSCTLYTYSWSGIFLASVSFVATEPTYDRALKLWTSISGYSYLICTLPPAGRGTLRGVTSW